MIALARTKSSSRRDRRQNPSPAALGIPDPRPLTDYSVALSTVGGHSRITITLSQPCVIRQPSWGVIDVSTGNKTYPLTTVVGSTTSFYMDYATILNSNFAFVEAPYQDIQVQNFQGGYVVPAAKWFRSPV